MTVLPRPVPKRIASNGIRPLLRAPANNIRPYTLKTWRPPVPEPLPPAPLLGPKELLGLGLLVAAQIWGRFKQTINATPPGEYYPLGPVQAAYGNNLRLCVAWNSACMSPAFNKFTSLSYTNGRWSFGSYVYDVTIRFVYANGTAETYQVPGGSTIEEIQRQKLVLAPGVSGIGEVQRPTVLAPGSLPEISPEAVPPKLPPLITPVTPTTDPSKQPTPEPERKLVPVEPGPKAPPATAPARPPVFRPIRPASSTGTKDGAIVPKPADPVTVTDPDAHYPIPGKGPIVGNGPRPTPEEMAKELGRLEQKLNSILNPVDSPVDWLSWLQRIMEALLSSLDGTTYTLKEYCNPTGDPNYVPPSWDFEAPGALNSIAVLQNRVDALASMMARTVLVKQQICLPTKPRPKGELVTVNFIADEKPPGSSAYLRKFMRYRDLSGSSEADHVAHWLGFEWQAGPAIVRSRGAAWGEVCVWAADPGEGRRVIKHAAAIARVDLRVAAHRWFDQVPRNPRYGRAGLMRVEHDLQGTPCVSKRVGPDGRPDWALDS
jgi:hypothetical protein